MMCITPVRPLRASTPTLQPPRFGQTETRFSLSPLEQKILNTMADLVVVHKAHTAKYKHDDLALPPESRTRVNPQIIELSQIYDAFDALKAKGMFHWFQNIATRRAITQALWQLSDNGFIRFTRSIHQTEFNRTRPSELPADYVALEATEKGLKANTVVLYQDVAPDPNDL